jgi:hypothetical protein
MCHAFRIRLPLSFLSVWVFMVMSKRWSGNENGMVIDGVLIVRDGAQEFHDDDCSFWRALSCVGVERATVSE